MVEGRHGDSGVVWSGRTSVRWSGRGFRTENLFRPGPHPRSADEAPAAQSCHVGGGCAVSPQRHGAERWRRRSRRRQSGCGRTGPSGGPTTVEAPRGLGLPGPVEASRRPGVPRGVIGPLMSGCGGDGAPLSPLGS
ncbi:hypothetical protein NDU88_007737 [Pleurodeles waltl]|uniref:Uncharacterized protein n=1 Tax=Pleurodeles waltl TaxID=8319 RepID=A0AAV7RVR3_PLEWA|nr:hypothetical protein NDU88_007737 [Pleurodeles waltl]